MVCLGELKLYNIDIIRLINFVMYPAFLNLFKFLMEKTILNYAYWRLKKLIWSNCFYFSILSSIYHKIISVLMNFRKLMLKLNIKKSIFAEE